MTTTRFYLYHLSLGVLGALWGFRALVSILTGGGSLPLTLMALGGIGMVVAVVYGLLTSDPNEFAVGRVSLAGVVLAALLTLIGVTLQSINAL
jgi:hypothetical protein